MGLNDQVRKPQVNSQSILSTLSDISKAVSWEDFKHHMEDYANLSTMFKQLVDDNAKLADKK